MTWSDCERGVRARSAQLCNGRGWLRLAGVTVCVEIMVEAVKVQFQFGYLYFKTFLFRPRTSLHTSIATPYPALAPAQPAPHFSTHLSNTTRLATNAAPFKKPQPDLNKVKEIERSERKTPTAAREAVGKTPPPSPPPLDPRAHRPSSSSKRGHGSIKSSASASSSWACHA